MPATSSRKGKTNQPVKIGIPREWLTLPLFEELEKKGHTLILMDDFATNECDVIFGPNCHMMTPEMARDTKLVPVALKAARKRKKDARD